MAEDEAPTSDSSESDPPEPLPSEADPALASWLERSRGQGDDAERR